MSSTWCDWCGHRRSWHHNNEGPCEAQPCACSHFRHGRYYGWVTDFEGPHFNIIKQRDEEQP
jgi:hypothetical protein